ncbi:hypothetical protein V7S43_004835 [Phytophthora oleae]|uniref:Calmodulin n=1 Tax=Phytophthora oleae TaxID=2107226 RepID=A0ABD3FVP9_9STRA
MSAPNEQEQWTAAQVRVLAATGLASSHLQPFTHLLYNDPKTPHRKSRTFLVESRDSDCRRHRERNGKFSATWTDSELFNVHSTVNWVELQLWNRFDNGFDVFLGKASVSLHQLRHEAKASGDSATTTGGLWFPLQTPEANGLGPHLSLQVECVFSSDPKVLHIQKEIKRRKKEKLRPKGEAADQEASEGEDEASNSVADPVFAFTRPFLPVEWSLLAATNVRQLFFHSDVERLAAFRDVVLYSDLDQELDDDADLQIDEAHVEAFKACQFSAQYLDHCVATLSQRLDLYTEDYRGLDDTREKLARKSKSLIAQRKRLRKEHDELELLIAAYRRVLEANDVTPSTEQLEQPNSPVRGSITLASPPISPTGSISPKKPQFLQTWEERERGRRLEKELSKAQRIGEEQQRLNQRALERQQRDDYEAFVSKAAHNREQRAARRLQAFFRDINRFLQTQRWAAETQAATLVQTAWRRFVHIREYPRRLEAKKQESEGQLMAQNEREMREYLAETERRRALSPPESVQSEEDAPSPSKQVVDALVATWRKLRRVFVLAHRAKGVHYHALFAAMDLRQDDVIDRAELRLGARSFNVRLDRKMTRALIALVRSKCGMPSKPLLVTFEQFLAGFELVEAADHPPKVNAVLISKETKRSDTVRSDLKVNEPLEATEDELEALVAAVRALRAAIYESASSFLAASGKAPSDFRAFREALVGIFSHLDADRNGQLDVEELVACVASFNLQLSSEKVKLLRELFVGDRESDQVGVAEFISFVLAEPSTDDELGLVGHKIREELATRVRAQAQTHSVEDAVRLVLGTHRKDQSCFIPEFVRALTRLRLDFTPTQLARLVVRLDRDGDRSISFDEVLLWLRLRSEPSSDEAAPERRAIADKATEKTEGLRHLLAKLASKTDLTALFQQIDRDNSGKINQEELREFLSQQDLTSIQEVFQLCQVSDPAALVAQEMMNLLDLNGNGVATLKEWLTVAQYEASQAIDPVVVDSVRKALKESENNDPERLVNWFNELPGAMRVQAEPRQVKMRVAEFKTALRTKLGGRSVPLQTVDRVVRSLDSDSSGWITTSELSTWAYPPRDLEELLRLVKKCWQPEYELNRGNLAATLYRSFDADGNGSLAVRELREGFETFGLSLSEHEARVLLISFDLDGDGCWSKAEFLAFVTELFPPEEVQAAVTQEPTSEDGNGFEDSAYSDDLLLESESDASSPSFSDAGTRPVEYSEDFVEE